MDTIKKYEQHIKASGYQRIINVVENIMLRPNDNKLLFGENYNVFKKAVENVLEENYKHDDIYKYYHELNNYDHGFCTFGRWKNGLLF